jgi:uncharacterized membrane protein YgcG
MKKLILTVLLIAAVASGARAMLWWRDKIASLWAAQPLSLDGGEAQWSKSDETDETSVIFRATNDSSDAYLLIAPDGKDGKGLLTGNYRQDSTLWFLGPDKKTRAWGLNIPYSRLDQLAPGTPVQPEYLTMQGTQVSTAPVPADISLRLDRDSRNPSIAIRIALKDFPSTSEKPIPLDFTTTPVPPDIAKQITSEKPKTHPAGSGGGGHHGGGRHGGGGAQGGQQGGAPNASTDTPSSSADAPTVPDPLSLELSLKLAPAPR